MVKESRSNSSCEMDGWSNYVLKMVIVKSNHYKIGSQRLIVRLNLLFLSFILIPDTGLSFQLLLMLLTLL